MQLLAEMDGFSSTEGIRVIAATNRMELLDKALLRPGRFDRIITISTPDKHGIMEILKIHTSKVPVSETVDMEKVLRKCEGLSGAEIKAVVTEAALSAIKSGSDDVCQSNFDEGVDRILSAVSYTHLTLPTKA